MYDLLRINGERLWHRLEEMAKIGATPNGGVCRLALSDEDKASRDLFVKWCIAAGCVVSVDQIGNIFARRQGKKIGQPPLIIGSHLDSQPTGGRFDGVLGVLAGLEIIETLNDHQIETETCLEVVVWTNEEGARFVPAMTGSGVFAGVFDLEASRKIKDKDGLTLGGELERIGYSGTLPAIARPVKAAFEVHIEQGPILEKNGKTIGVVTGVQGMNWYNLTLFGKEVHAGPTPMESRHDPVRGAIKILDRLYKLVASNSPWGRVTFGDIKTEPGIINTVAGHMTITVDLRHPDQTILDRMDHTFREIVDEECERLGLGWQIERIWNSPAVDFDPECIKSVRTAVNTIGCSSIDIISGAGHDSVHLTRIAPTGMIFIPCKDGLSHNEAEHAEKEDVVSGCNVLLHAMLMLAHT